MIEVDKSTVKRFHLGVRQKYKRTNGNSQFKELVRRGRKVMFVCFNHTFPKELCSLSVKIVCLVFPIL